MEKSAKRGSRRKRELPKIFLNSKPIQRVDSVSSTVVNRPTRLQSSEDHSVLFLDEVRSRSSSQPSIPAALNNASKLRIEHVRMPCSNRNESFASQDEVDKRWKDVQRTLLHCKFSTFEDVKAAILSYNAYASKWNFDGLKEFIDNTLDKNEREVLFNITLPKIARLAVNLPVCLKQPIPLLRKGMNHTVTMTQQQAACLLANALFCTFPPRSRLPPDAKGNTFTDINFSRLFALTETGTAKLNCIFHYFSRILTKMPKGVISFERRCLDQFPDWSKSMTSFTKLQAHSKGTIEDDGVDMLQVDFASKFVGGGVFLARCVQEEIRFLINPEMIVSRLFTEELEDNECLVMTGCERFSQYKGYGHNFQWAKPYNDTSTRDEWNRLKTQVVAIDAKPYKFLGYDYGSQFTKKEMVREINKAYCGFFPSAFETASGQLAPVATGNWGCGGYGGDRELKSIIQYMAASECNRDVTYFTFGDSSFAQDLNEVAKLFRENQVTVGQVFNMIVQYYEKFVKPTATLTPKPTTTLFDFILSVDFDEKKKSNMSCCIS